MTDKVIYKYPAKEGNFLLPKGYKILHCDIQNGALTLWAEVDPERGLVAVDIKIVGTGDKVPEGMVHIGSTLNDAPFVWHFYL